MTRPKVPPDQRQRTAQACESCKRRKQKCNGLCPCNTCEKRKFTCIYSERDAASPSEGSSAKKRMLESGEADQDHDFSHDGDGSTADTPFNGHTSHSSHSHHAPISPSQQNRGSFTAPNANVHPEAMGLKHEDPRKPVDEGNTMEAAARSLQQFAAGPPTEEQPTLISRGTSQSGQDEEAVVYTQTRMLQDPTGRLLYVGDSATLSFLQLLRMMVENVAGPSTFTNDPQRHKIVEGQFSLQSSGRHTHLLPNKRTAVVLVDAFFINTHGFLQVFERQIFLGELERCYSDPLSTEPSWLCLLNLVFAIGLMLATPRPGGNESVTIEKLRSERLDRAEVFYLNAKSLNDPMTGFEDADFWSVQALLLMSVYMLAKSKRNTAFALLGMAVRSAYALGLHREETMVIFSPDEQAARRNLWRSLFVVDRFLSCSLGRPTAISEDDCSGDTLRPSNSHGDTDAFGFNATFPSTSTFNQTSAFALEAAVRSCSVIGKILKRVYQQRKISTRLAQEIADICKLWPKALAPSLHWRQAATASPSQGIAILHVNLFYCHSIILLTRPFFLFIVNAEAQKDVTQSMTGVRPGRNYSRMEKFSEACVIASTHTIVLVQNAFEAGYLPRRNPTVIYFLFAATLVILANEFTSLYTNLTVDQCILNAVAVMAYCAEGDQQASRLLYILSTFRDTVAAQRACKNRSHTGMMGMGSIPAQMYATSQQQPHISSPLHTTHQPPLHQTPVHVYPDLHRSPYLNTSHATQTRYAPSSHPDHTQNPAPPQQPSASIRSPQPTAGNPPDLAFNPTFSRPISLSNVLDLSAFDAARAPSLHSEESSGPDEDIDFDALWAWPSSTPALGSPRFGADAAAGAQGASESAVPLFAVISGNERPRGKTSGDVTG